MSKKEVEREVLTEDQLKRIAQQHFGADRLALVRDIFLFCCYTGLAYADIEKLRQTEIIKGSDGDCGSLQNGRKQMLHQEYRYFRRLWK